MPHVKATLDVVMIIITPPVCPNLNLRTCPAFQHTTVSVSNITPGANFTFRTLEGVFNVNELEPGGP